jgi:hypothetical protein
MIAANPSREQVSAWIDKLDRAEPHGSRGSWSAAYDGLRVALLHARKIRRYCLIPSVIVAVAVIIFFHGEAWDGDDVRNLIIAQTSLLFLSHFLLTKMFAVLADEDRVQTLLRYYGAQDVPPEHEAMQ